MGDSGIGVGEHADGRDTVCSCMDDEVCWSFAHSHHSSAIIGLTMAHSSPLCGLCGAMLRVAFQDLQTAAIADAPMLALLRFRPAQCEAPYKVQTACPCSASRRQASHYEPRVTPGLHSDIVHCCSLMRSADLRRRSFSSRALSFDGMPAIFIGPTHPSSTSAHCSACVQRGISKVSGSSVSLRWRGAGGLEASFAAGLLPIAITANLAGSRRPHAS